MKFFEEIADWSDRLGPDLFLPIFYPEIIIITCWSSHNKLIFLAKY